LALQKFFGELSLPQMFSLVPEYHQRRNSSSAPEFIISAAIHHQRRNSSSAPEFIH